MLRKFRHRLPVKAVFPSDNLPPTDLNISTAGKGIELSWTDNSSNEDGYEILRASGNSSEQVIHTTEPNITSFIDETFPENSQVTGNEFTYNVRGRKGSRSTVPTHKRTTYTSHMWYGIRLDESNSSPDLQRIAGPGYMHLHEAGNLPVHQMRACLMADNGSINYYLDQSNWSQTPSGSPSVLSGQDGMVMMHKQAFWRKKEEIAPGVYDLKVSMYPQNGWQYFTGYHPVIPGFFFGSYEASVHRPTLKLSSVMNNTADYRGGNNNSAWDAEGRTLLGKPATAISMTNCRTYARNRGSIWNQEIFLYANILYELYQIEYATLNSQKAINNTLTAQGYRQGGLGSGLTTANSTEWANYNSYYPIVNCGVTNSLGSGSGEVSVTVNNFGGSGVNRTFTPNRYRGIENPFGHIWKWQDGVSVFHEAAGGASKLYFSDNPANFADGTATGYEYRGDLPTAEGWVKWMTHDYKCLYFPKTLGGSNVTFFCDYYYTPGLINSWRAFLRGGSLASGTYAGFAALSTHYAASYTHAYIGARLCV